MYFSDDILWAMFVCVYVCVPSVLSNWLAVIAGSPEFIGHTPQRAARSGARGRFFSIFLGKKRKHVEKKER